MKRIKHRSDIENHLAVPLLAQLRHHASSSGDPPLLAEGVLGIPLSDAQRTRKDFPINPLLVTSACPAEGKTTFTASYGIALAQSGYRVLLVDGDFYRPTLHKKLNIPNSFGMGDLMCKSLECLVDAIQETSMPYLFVLPVGRLPAHLSSLCDSAMIPQILDQLKSQFDIVLVDAPPVLVIEAAAVVLASYVNNVVLVVRKGKTILDDCREAIEQLRLAGATVHGAAITDFREPRPNEAQDAVLYDLGKHGEAFPHSLSLNPCPEIDLYNADLEEANLYKSDLQEADFHGANLRGAFLFRSVLKEASLYRVNLQGANLAAADLRRANLGIADLQSAVLFRANLREANLALANLSGANLYGADLRGANLSYAYLQGTDFGRANLEGAILNRAKLDHDTCLPDGTKWTPETDLAQFTKTN